MATEPTTAQAKTIQTKDPTPTPPAGELDRLLAKPTPPTFGPDMQLTTLSDALAFAQVVFDSGMAPKGARGELMSVPTIAICIQMGYEVGLSPMQAVQNIASINGKPAIYGDAQLALIRASGLMESYAATPIGDPGADSRGFRVTVKRTGNLEASDEFTVADAKRAGLWGKAGPWTQYPQRMLMFRARGFILRDQFGDVLKGLKSAEEVMDEPRDITAEVEVHTAPVSRLARKPKAEAPAATIEDAPADLKPAPAPAANPEAPSVKPIQAESALKGAGAQMDHVLRFLIATGRTTVERGMTGCSQEFLIEAYTNPGKIAKIVSRWVDEEDARAEELRIMAAAAPEQQ
jgi:hypothetical protein